MASWALLRRLVLTQKDADVLLVSLLLEIAEERKYSLVAATLGMEQQLPLRRWELVPRGVHRDPLALRELGERAALVVVARLGPRIDGAVAQRAGRVGNDQRLVVLENRAEAVALRARAAGIVEREKLGSRRRRNRPVVGAVEALGEAQLVHGEAVERRNDVVGEQDHAVAFTLGERGSDGIAQPAAAFCRNRQPIDYHQQLFGAGDVALRRSDLV